MRSPARALPPIGSEDGCWLWTLFVCGASSHSAAALVAVRRLCAHLLPDQVELRIHDIRSDPAAAVAAGVLAVPCLVTHPPALAGEAPRDQAGPSALQLRIDQLEVALAAITSGTADALLVGSNDPAAGGGRLFMPDTADEPYRAIVEQMGDGVGTLSADGLLLYANPRLMELLNRPGEMMLGRPLAELFPASQRACLERLRKVSPGRTERAELELLPDAEGDAVRVLVSVSGLAGTGIGTQCLIVTDLSGLQTSGIKPACDDQRYRFLAEAVSAFVVETDGQRRVRWVSPSVHAVLGWMPQELLGACLTDLLHPEESLETEPTTGQRQPLVRLRARNGTDHWMRLLSWPLRGEGCDPYRWIIGFQDVGELVEHHQARAIDQARLAAVLMSSSGPQLVLDALRQPDGAVTDFVCAAANDAACRRYGLTRHALVGRRLLQALPAHAAVGLFALCQRVLESDGSMAWGELDEPSGADAEERRCSLRVVRVGDVLGCSWGGGVRDSATLSLRRLQPTAGLVSRSELFEQVARLHPPAHRRTKPLALALCHLRNLREIHERHGAASAARVLRTIEARLRQVLRHDAIVARVSVEQLLVVLGGMDNHAQAEATAESMRIAVNRPLPIPDAAIRISLGVDVTLQQPGQRLEDLISSALQKARVSGPFRLAAIATH